MNFPRISFRNTLCLFILLIMTIPFDYAMAMRPGVKIGLSHSNFHGEDASGAGFDSKLGLSFGMFFLFPLNEFLSIQPEVLYNQKGAKQEYDIYGMGNIKYTVILDYLEVPLHVKFSMPGKLNFTPSLILGSSFAVKIRGLTREKYGDHSEDDDLNNIRSYDAGIDLGLCFDIRLGKRMLNLDVRYNYGLFSISKGEDDWTPKIKNKSLFFTVGYTL